MFRSLVLVSRSRYRPREVSELYDLTTDPRELVNLWGTPSVAVVQQRMLDGLLNWFQETTDVTPLAVDITLVFGLAFYFCWSGLTASKESNEQFSEILLI